MSTTYIIGKNTTEKYAVKTDDGVNFSNITYPFATAYSTIKTGYLNGTIYAIYLNNNNLYNSSDFGATWTKITTNISISADYFFPLNGKLYAFGVSSVNATTCAYSTDGTTWTTATSSTNLPHGGKLVVTDTAVYILSGDFSGVNSNAIYKTTDGLTWTNIGTYDTRSPYVYPTFININGTFFYLLITDADATNMYTLEVHYGSDPVNISTKTRAADIPFTWDSTSPIAYNANGQLHIINRANGDIWRLSADFSAWSKVGTSTTLPAGTQAFPLFVSGASTLLLTANGQSTSTGNVTMTLSNLLTPSFSSLSISSGNVQLSFTVDTFLIQGKATLNSSGVQGVQVVAVHENLINIYHTTTDSSGNYTLEVNQTGNYTLFVSYTDESGNKYTSTTKPYIRVDGVA